VVVLNGAKPGPRLYLGAAIHGDEVSGVPIVSRTLAAVDPAKLCGSVIAIPVQHPLSFHADHRIPISQFIKSPLDQAPADAWTCFPGDPDGNLAQLVSAKLFSLIKQCSFLIDIHTPTRGGRYVPIAILPSAAAGPDAGRAAWLAEQFASGYTMKTDTGFYVARGILCVEATAAGIPGFTFEIGEGGRLEEEVIAEGVRCVTNALIGLGMIAGERKLPKKSYLMREFLGIRAKRGGLLQNLATLGELVEKGQPLVRITDIYGDPVDTIVAPETSVFVRSTTLSTVSTGERVVTLGLL
jgi:predicted deacylase